MFRSVISFGRSASGRPASALYLFQVVDKAEYRTYTAQALVQLLDRLPSEEYAAFIAWLYKYSRSSKVGGVSGKSPGRG